MNERYERGAARLAGIDGPADPRHATRDSLADIAPDLGRFAVEFAYGDIHSRPGLDAATRELVTLAVLTTLGGCEPQLEVHFGTGLNAGLTPEQIVEALLQALPYAGFPRVINAVLVARRVLAARNLLPVGRLR